ncbi:hypothetical protein S40285_03307 [Stachybotrys chlorohalonatus IBT 40285]|uniref:non-specific serine/threonine protein kinase n=1 Tax=Stachybotrys chlorohalonatus (strain IBT 40285) TaxID=1283841 RepID=A0A084R1J4_STAC4|nr:hypothetical protein S40285_03307 [Stachybotrys chlorohalonata IBT 40285]
MPSTTLPSFHHRQPRLENIEEVEKYVPGGYHAVDIDDVIDAGKDSYKVIHKLGPGGFSTVWLVLSCREIATYYALKIICADASGPHELEVLQHIEKASLSGHPHVAMLHDSLRVSGPNGEDQCLTFPVLGLSLYNQEVNASLPDILRHQVYQQVADTLEFLHICGICHGNNLCAISQLKNGEAGSISTHTIAEQWEHTKETEPAWWYQHGRSQKTICGRLAQEVPRPFALKIEEYVQLLKSMMAYEPEEHFSAKDVVQLLRKLTA